MESLKLFITSATKNEIKIESASIPFLYFYIKNHKKQKSYLKFGNIEAIWKDSVCNLKSSSIGFDDLTKRQISKIAIGDQ